MEGVRWVSASPILRQLGGLIAVVNFTQAATQSILVLFSLEKLGLTQRAYGWLLAAVGVGGAFGGLLGGARRRRLGAGMLFTSTILLTIPAFLVLGTTSSPLVAAPMLALNAFLGVTANVLMNSLRQLIVPDRLLARVNSVMGLIAVGISLPTGSLAGGLLADRLGLRGPFFVSAALIAGAAVLVPRVAGTLAHSLDASGQS
jgi:predicted MFS family arabinose efflux permease